MTYYEVIRAVEACSLANLSVNSFYEGDVYKINSASDVGYAAVILTPQAHSLGEYLTTYNFNLFYVDRLTWDRDDEYSGNKLFIQSEAITTLKEILNRLSSVYEDIDLNYSLAANVFTEKFSDECAGAFVSFSVEVENEIDNCFYDGE